MYLDHTPVFGANVEKVFEAPCSEESRHDRRQQEEERQDLAVLVVWIAAVYHDEYVQQRERQVLEKHHNYADLRPLQLPLYDQLLPHQFEPLRRRY